MSTVHSSIDHHPDLLALRERYERAAESMTAQGTFGLTLLTAVYAAVSPWIVGFAGTRPLVVSDFTVGLVCVALAFAYAMASDRSHGMTWTLPVFGVWFIISPGLGRCFAARRHDLVERDRRCGADRAGLERDVLRYARS